MNVAFLIYRRPDATRRVFEEIRKTRPRRLLVVADGPRNEEEAAACDAARAVVQATDWPCEVMTNYAATNMGCRRRVATGLDWVFSTVEEAVILEDDCLPDPSFFPYCSELLERFRDDPRVMHIGGNNFQRGKIRTPFSYYFSKYPHIWGWATWRRAWRNYDVAMQAWPAFRADGRLAEVCPDFREQVFWNKWFETAYRGEIDTWDYAWVFACWSHGGLAVTPERNLVVNIGFGSDATHTRRGEYEAPGLSVGSVSLTLRHPACIEVNRRADRRTFQKEFLRDPGLVRRWKDGFRNRHFWGLHARSLPFVGRILRRRGTHFDGERRGVREGSG